MTSATYSAKAAPAIGYLKSSINDIEVFVEDTASPNTWVKLLKQYLPNHVRLNSVTPLGGRKKVLDACKADQIDDGRKKLYIIDGDLDLIQGKRKPNLKHLYRLRAYCVENYLLNESSIVDVVTILDGKVDSARAQVKLDYSTWTSYNSMPSKRLFISYAVSNSLRHQIPTVSYNVSRLVKDRPNNDSLCNKKTEMRIFNIYKQTRKEVSRAKLRECFSAYKTRVAVKKFEDVVSGKDYIIPLLHNRMKNLFKIKGDRELFIRMLADKASKQIDPYLERRLTHICG